MIYFLFIASFIGFLTFKTFQSYYESFEVQTAPKKENDKPTRRRFTYSSVSKILAGLILKARKTNWILVSKGTERKLSIVKGISNFLRIFCCVAFIFCVLQFWLDHTTDIKLAQATVLQIEQTQFKIKEFVSHFKIASSYDILIIIVLIALAGSLPIVEQYKLKDKFKKYNKAVKSILYVLTISTSFTFFGNKFSEKEEGRIGELEIHKLEIIGNNKLLLKQINEEVAEKVVNEILSNPKVENALDKVEEAKENIQTATSSDDYKKYFSAAASSIANLSITNFENSVYQKYNFLNGFESAESKFQNAYQQNSPNAQSDYYKTKEETNYSNFKQSNKQWFDEKSFSENSAKQAEETFTKAKQASQTKFSKYYATYKEPIDKLIKKGYKNTGAKWVKDIFETIGVDFPFMDEFIEPIINQPAEDFMTKKSETIFKYAFDGNSEAAESELNKCSSEFKTTFANSVNSSKKFAILENNVAADFLKSKSIIATTENEIRMEYVKADNHLNEMCSKSRWERIRKTFKQRLNNGEQIGDFSYEQQENFKSVLNDWEKYKSQNKFSIYNGKGNDIEELFFNYSKNDGLVKACWGFILQQQDWDGAAYYYTVTNPERATGKPYYLLKYYYNSIGKGGQVESLYDTSTEEGVGTMCRPVLTK